MGQAHKSKPKHGRGHLVGDYQESGQARAPDEMACEKAPGGLVGNYQDGGQCADTRQARERDALGRPNPNEDKDMNREQLKGRTKARPGNAQPAPRQSAERVDPTEQTRAGERR